MRKHREIERIRKIKEALQKKAKDSGKGSDKQLQKQVEIFMMDKLE